MSETVCNYLEIYVRLRLKNVKKISLLSGFLLLCLSSIYSADSSGTTGLPGCSRGGIFDRMNDCGVNDHTPPKETDIRKIKLVNKFNRTKKADVLSFIAKLQKEQKEKEIRRKMISWLQNSTRFLIPTCSTKEMVGGVVLTLAVLYGVRLCKGYTKVPSVTGLMNFGSTALQKYPLIESIFGKKVMEVTNNNLVDAALNATEIIKI